MSDTFVTIFNWYPHHTHILLGVRRQLSLRRRQCLREVLQCSLAPGCRDPNPGFGSLQSLEQIIAPPGVFNSVDQSAHREQLLSLPEVETDIWQDDPHPD